MSLIKTKEEIELLKEGGERLSSVLNEVVSAVVPGVSTAKLDKLAEYLIRKSGDTPAFLNYQPTGAKIPFPATLCVSINNEVVHGIPHESRVLNEGDIVGLDLGLVHEGLFTDMAVTVAVGQISSEDKKLIEITRISLERAIAVVRDGAHIGDVGEVVENYAREEGMGVVGSLGGHGVGHTVHEEPYIPNVGKAGTGEELKEGMVIALEPMINLGGDDVRLAKDKFTFETSDGSKSAHFEVTLAVTKTGAEVLTPFVNYKNL